MTGFSRADVIAGRCQPVQNGHGVTIPAAGRINTSTLREHQARLAGTKWRKLDREDALKLYPLEEVDAYFGKPGVSTKPAVCTHCGNQRRVAAVGLQHVLIGPCPICAPLSFEPYVINIVEVHEYPNHAAPPLPTVAIDADGRMVPDRDASEHPRPQDA